MLQLINAGIQRYNAAKIYVIFFGEMGITPCTFWQKVLKFNQHLLVIYNKSRAIHKKKLKVQPLEFQVKAIPSSQ